RQHSNVKVPPRCTQSRSPLRQVKPVLSERNSPSGPFCTRLRSTITVTLRGCMPGPQYCAAPSFSLAMTVRSIRSRIAAQLMALRRYWMAHRAIQAHNASAGRVGRSLHSNADQVVAGACDVGRKTAGGDHVDRLAYFPRLGACLGNFEDARGLDLYLFSGSGIGCGYAYQAIGAHQVARTD